MDEQNRVETPMPLPEAQEMGRIEAERKGLPEGGTLSEGPVAKEVLKAAEEYQCEVEAVPAPAAEAGATGPQGPATPEMPAATAAGATGQIWRAEKPGKTDTEKPERPGGAAVRENSFKEKVWKPFLHPVLALVVICLVTSFLLGLTNSYTAPLIEQNARAAADEARRVLLPGADGFEAVPLTEEVAGATAIYRATNGAGYVVEASAAGYGGQVPAMVAFGEDGTILGVTFLENSETPGLGKKLETDESFAEQFKGLPGEAITASDIDRIANATVSSNAAVSAINAAISLFNRQVLGLDDSDLTPQQVVDKLAGATPPTPITLQAEGVLPDAYKTSYGYIIYGVAEGAHGPVTAAVAMNEEGVAEDFWIDTSGEGAGYGDVVGKDEAFIEAMKHQTYPVQADVVAGGTVTSEAVLQAVNNALAALPAAKEADQ